MQNKKAPAPRTSSWGREHNTPRYHPGSPKPCSFGLSRNLYASHVYASYRRPYAIPRRSNGRARRRLSGFESRFAANSSKTIFGHPCHTPSQHGFPGALCNGRQRLTLLFIADFPCSVVPFIVICKRTHVKVHFIYYGMKMQR